MQVTEFLRRGRPILSWQVRTPLLNEDETYNQARDRMLAHAEAMGMQIRFLYGKGRFGKTPRYHFWEIKHESDAFAFHFTFGDHIKPQGHTTIA